MRGVTGTADAVTEVEAEAMPVSEYMLKYIKRFRRGFARDSPQMEILSECYRDGSVTARDLARHGNRHNLLGKMVARRYMQKKGGSSGGRHGAMYELTLLGKCKVLCTRLDTGLLGLCILVEAHVMYGYQQEADLEVSYTLHALADIFSLLFSLKTIQSAAHVLRSKGLADRTRKNTIRLRLHTVSVLGEHQDVVDEIHEWIVKAQRRLERAALAKSLGYDRNPRYDAEVRCSDA